MPNSKPRLTIQRLRAAAKQFAKSQSGHAEPSLFGVTDGKAVGTYLEHKFRSFIGDRFMSETGNSASGIDFPSLSVDVKTTSIRQPQSSCPFKSARQKVFGLGYNLLVFVYEKFDDQTNRVAGLHIQHVIFVAGERTGDYQMTKGILEIIQRDGNEDDLVAFMQDRMLPADEIAAREIARDVLRAPPQQGFLTISNALQWRLQYGRAIERAGSVKGVTRIL